MKKLIPIFLFLIVVGFAHSVVAQGKKTIILIRHAERESGSMTSATDPPLSTVGQERANRVIKRIGKFRPGVVYSTNYLRTRQTVEPLAKKRNKTIKTYDPAKPQDLINEINSSKTKRFLIVGHSNTIPPLANLLTGKDLFKNLQETEYSVIYVIRMKNGKVSKVELVDY